MERGRLRASVAEDHPQDTARGEDLCSPDHPRHGLDVDRVRREEQPGARRAAPPRQQIERQERDQERGEPVQQDVDEVEASWIEAAGERAVQGEAEAGERTVESLRRSQRGPVRRDQEPGEPSHVLHQRVLDDDGPVIEDEFVVQGGEVEQDRRQGTGGEKQGAPLQGPLGPGVGVSGSSVALVRSTSRWPPGPRLITPSRRVRRPSATSMSVR